MTSGKDKNKRARIVVTMPVWLLSLLEATQATDRGLI